jgi:hypothetical protein
VGVLLPAEAQPNFVRTWEKVGNESMIVLDADSGHVLCAAAPVLASTTRTTPSRNGQGEYPCTIRSRRGIKRYALHRGSPQRFLRRGLPDSKGELRSGPPIM